MSVKHELPILWDSSIVLGIPILEIRRCMIGGSCEGALCPINRAAVDTKIEELQVMGPFERPCALHGLASFLTCKKHQQQGAASALACSWTPAVVYQTLRLNEEADDKCPICWGALEIGWQVMSCSGCRKFFHGQCMRITDCLWETGICPLWYVTMFTRRRRSS